MTRQTCECEEICCNYNPISCSIWVFMGILFAPMIAIPLIFAIWRGPQYFNIGSVVLGAISGMVLAWLSLAVGIVKNRSMSGCDDFCPRKLK